MFRRKGSISEPNPLPPTVAGPGFIKPIFVRSNSLPRSINLSEVRDGEAHSPRDKPREGELHSSSSDLLLKLLFKNPRTQSPRQQQVQMEAGDLGVDGQVIDGQLRESELPSSPSEKFILMSRNIEKIASPRGKEDAPHFSAAPSSPTP